MSDECDTCKGLTDFDLLWAMVKCGACGRSGGYLLPELKVPRGGIKFPALSDD